MTDENIITATVTGSMLVLTPGAASGANGGLWHQETVTITAIDNDEGRGTVSFAVTTRANVLDVGMLAPGHGFIIQGDAGGDMLGSSVSGAGDVNGDGLDDLIVGAPQGDDGAGTGVDAGEAYIIYGKADPDPADGAAGTQFGTAMNSRQVLDTTNLKPADGFIIQGDEGREFEGDELGVSVSRAGDVNGDGLADLIVGAHRGEEAYIIYGKADTDGDGMQFGSTETGGTRQVLDVTTLAPTDGFVLRGDAAGDKFGISVSGVGDLNGDGVGDLIVGAYEGDDGTSDAGEAYIVYGKAGNGDGTQFGTAVTEGGEMRQVLDVTTLAPTDGFILQGDVGDDRLGWSVSGAGDINGDGLADLIVGAYKGDDGGSKCRGGLYHLWESRHRRHAIWHGRDRGGGAPGSGYHEPQAAEGFILQGDAAGDQLGVSVSGAGDINGDGLDDLIVGAPFGDDGGINAGEAYIIYGKAGTDGTQFGMTP